MRPLFLSQTSYIYPVGGNKSLITALTVEFIVLLEYPNCGVCEEWLDSVVATVEGNDEGAGLIVGLRGHEFGVEPQDVHVLLEHFFHVILWRLGLQSDNGRL
jgi:hypothetical protein